MARIVCFGEIMLRLSAPGRERLFQSPSLDAIFGGGEANVAVSLATLGHEAVFASAVPDDPLGQAALRELRKHGVDVSAVKLEGPRLGVYYLETGSDQRPSSVTYDRAGSSMSLVGADSFDWPAILAGADWFHVSGITPALSASAAEACRAALAAARAAGAKSSIDLNYRKKLWNYGKKAVDAMRPLAAMADVLIANEEDIQNCLGIAAEGADPGSGKVPREAYFALASRVRAEFPNVGAVAVTLRESLSADRNGWGAVLSAGAASFASREYALDDIVDRVGAGDSFAAGLIHGFLSFGGDAARVLEFATAASALKHSIPGDFNLSTLAEIQALAAGGSGGRVSR
jgi:2-dehydro-3-deoxygluconokinase